MSKIGAENEKGDLVQMSQNVDPETVNSFGDEWERHRQDNLSEGELQEMWLSYFSIFPWDDLPKHAVGFDMGSGTGRWAQFVAPRVGFLHIIDAAAPALRVAEDNLSGIDNVQFHNSTTETVEIPVSSCDFGYSLGVLHHIPDTQAALADCVRLLKPGAPFLVYLYYRFDNRPKWFLALWRISDFMRKIIYRLPGKAKATVTDLIAFLVYWPLSRVSRILEKIGFSISSLPLSYYRHSSVATLRTDSRDRFGTPLEQRFTKMEIRKMMQKAGLVEIVFSDREPFWVALGRKE